MCHLNSHLVSYRKPKKPWLNQGKICLLSTEKRNEEDDYLRLVWQPRNIPEDQISSVFFSSILSMMLLSLKSHNRVAVPPGIKFALQLGR